MRPDFIRVTFMKITLYYGFNYGKENTDLLLTLELCWYRGGGKLPHEQRSPQMSRLVALCLDADVRFTQMYATTPCSPIVAPGYTYTLHVTPPYYPPGPACLDGNKRKYQARGERLISVNTRAE